MAYLQTSYLVWTLGFIQIAGLASAALARLSEGSRSQAFSHYIFFGCLAMIGLATLATIPLGPRYWLASGITLSVMMLAAIWDFRPHAQPKSI